MPKRAPPQPLTREDLDRAGCDNPAFTHEHDDQLFFNGRCHPKADVAVVYSKRTGLLRVTCAVCNSTVAYVAVARGNELVKTDWHLVERRT